MKRSKILSLFALFLSALMLFSSCGLKKNGSLKDILDKDAKADVDSVYRAGAVVGDLKDASYVKGSGNLALFTKPVENKDGETDWIIYNLKTNSVVYKETATDKIEVSIGLKKNSYYETFCSYFVVTLKTKGEGENAKPKITTAIYDEKGKSVASADYAEQVDSVLDLICFDGKCYRVDANGGISMAFEYSPLALFPNVSAKIQGYYYDLDEDTSSVAVYDDKLNLVSKYMVGFEDAETNFTVLENGNVFIQYAMMLDSHAEDYDVLVVDGDESEKYNYVSQILDIKKNAVKDVDCDYVIWYGINLLEENGYYANGLGANTDEVAVIGYGYKIVDKRLTNGVMLSMDAKGNVTELGEMNGSPISSVKLFDTNRWVVGTLDERAYVVDGEGNLIGEVTNVDDPYGKLFYVNGKLYNSNLSVVKNLTAEGWQIYDDKYGFETEDKDFVSERALISDKYYRSYGDMILLVGASGEMAICSQSGDINVLIEKDSDDEIVIATSTYVVVSGEKEYKVYNKNGELVLSIAVADGATYQVVKSVYTGDGAALLMLQKTATTADTVDKEKSVTQETVYYRLG